MYREYLNRGGILTGAIVRAATARYVLAAALISLTGCNSDSSVSAVAPTSASAVTSAGGDASLRVVKDLPPPQNITAASETKISQNDLLQIDVFQVQDLNREVRVGGDGNISLPLIGNVQAAGKTTAELERTLESRYGASYLQSPDISVFQKEAFGSRITLDGEFQKPGIYPSTAQSTLLQMVAQGGGLTKLADEKKVYIYRDVGSGRQVANYSIADIRAGKRADPKLYGGDVVVVFTSSGKIALQNLKDALGVASSASRLAVF
jgi:polysaccharide export outer membrane protein